MTLTFREFHKSWFFDVLPRTVDLGDDKSAHFGYFLQFIKNHEGSIDAELAKIFLIQQYLIFNEFSEGTALLSSLETSEYPIIKFFTNYFWCYYYSGLNNPVISREKAEYHRTKVTETFSSMNYENDWEKYIVLSYKLSHEWSFCENRDEKIKLIDTIRQAFLKIPEYGEQNAQYIDIVFGTYFNSIGRFDEAIASMQYSSKVYGDSDTLIMIYYNIAEIYRNKGEFERAEKYCDLITERLRPETLYFFAKMALNTLSIHAEIKQEYQLAESYLVRLYTRSFTENTLLACKAIYELFHFYLRRYSESTERNYLEKVIDHRDMLGEYAKNHPEELTINRLSQLADANTLKLGGTREKGKAIDIFEEILSIYHNDISICMGLVEMYFDDLDSDVFGTSKNRIEELIQEIEKNPIMTNPQSILSYSPYQILIAKYYFFLNGDIEKALEILHDLKTSAEKYHIKSLIETISREINVLESEITKWRDVDKSLLERIEGSNFREYIKQAQSMVFGDN